MSALSALKMFSFSGQDDVCCLDVESSDHLCEDGWGKAFTCIHVYLKHVNC